MASGHSKRVCIVGAGLSGLVTAKVFLADGFDVDVFEKRSEIGGSWNPKRTYPGLRTNDPREIYRFCDHDYPASADEFPTAQQVLAYLKSYADRFDLHPHIELETKVETIRRANGTSGDADTRFRVDIEPSAGAGSGESRLYDHVVICNGVFCRPHVPEFPGVDRYSGQLAHSSEVNEQGQLEDRRVVVIGGGKSAYDCAEVAGKYADSCHLVFRSAHWLVPRYVGRMRTDWLILTRLAQALLPYHTKRGVPRLLHRWAAPLISLYWVFQTWMVRRLNNAPPVLEPERSLPKGFQNLGSGTEVYDAVRAGQIEPVRTEISAFTGDKEILLETGETLTADLVICATGWNQPLDILDAELASLVRQDDFFTLYRHILPPEEQNLGFIGYASSIGNNVTSEVSAHWLSAFFRGEFDVPDVEAMYRHIEKVKVWTREMLPNLPSGHGIAGYIVDYIDDLMRDMGRSPHQANNIIEEYFGRIHADRFAETWEPQSAERDDSMRPEGLSEGRTEVPIIGH